MDYSNYIYVAACIFTQDNPELSETIQKYIKTRFNMPIIRCCVPNYKVKELAEQIPCSHRSSWDSLPSYTEFGPENTMVYLCHNCSAIFEETQPEVRRLSLWELINEDKDFKFPDFGGEKMTVQDCWRSYDNRAEQDAVREVMKKMNIDIVELDDNYEKTQFCGSSLYKATPVRNLKLAPKRYVENAEGKFIPHSEDEIRAIMNEHCSKITTDKVVAYCHYCIRGLKMTDKKSFHLATLLFDPDSVK